jgi:aminopeptidase
MDPRVRDHAATIVNHSTAVSSGDNVIVRSPPIAEDLVVALAAELGECGASPLFQMHTSRAERSYRRSITTDALATPTHEQAAVEEADVVIHISGHRNTRERSDISEEATTAWAKIRKPINQKRRQKRWVVTQYPGPGDAQTAEMSTEAYAEFVYGAINRDWTSQRRFQQQLVEVLDSATEVRIFSGDTTDIRMRLDGMNAISDYGEHNLPGGEVYTAPVPESVSGTIHFDMPVSISGTDITQVELKFKEGIVVDFTAEQNERVLETLLETDDGARRVGELGIGMNRAIDQFTNNLLFDEKMGDTAHLALGQAMAETVGDTQPLNKSAIHQDMIIDLSERSHIKVDGRIIYRDGTFRFEDGFGG